MPLLKYFLMCKKINIYQGHVLSGKCLHFYNFPTFIIIIIFFFYKISEILKSIKIVSTIFSWFYLGVPLRWNWCQHTVAQPPQVWRRFCTHLCAPCPRSYVCFPCWPWFLTDLLQLWSRQLIKISKIQHLNHENIGIKNRYMYFDDHWTNHSLKLNFFSLFMPNIQYYYCKPRITIM